MDISKVNCEPWHSGQNHCNRVYDWMHTDNQDNFQRMMQDPVHQEYFERQGWMQPGAIQYRINSNGFRGNELQCGGIMALGCSFTFGSGLPESVIWPTLMAQQLNTHVNNLACPGTAVDTAFRLAEYWISVLKPTLVCLLAPPRNRLELMMASGDTPAEVFMPMSEIKGSQHDSFLKHWFSKDQNAQLNQRRNCLAIKAMCNQHSVPLIIKYADQEMSRSREELEYARDYMHAGPLGHRLLVKKMLDEY